MKTKNLHVLAAMLLALTLPACAAQPQSPTDSAMAESAGAGSSSTADAAAAESAGATDASSTADSTSAVATSADMAEPVELDVEGLKPVEADEIAEGTYHIAVDSSSSMFRITDCELTVKDGAMTARMTMSGTGYLYLYPGTAEEAAAANEGDYIAFEEKDGAHTFTVPIESLDAPLPYAAFSKKKEMWYDRTLVFRADSLPAEARLNNDVTTVASLNLEDGTYTVAVTLEGGSGKATVDSPAELVVKGGVATARIVWSSPNYDYMVVNGKRLDPVNTEGNSTFEVPVEGFDYNMPVTADTTAMSKPHEIDYTLHFDSSTIAPTDA